MKPISVSSFCNKYPLDTTPEDNGVNFVSKGKKRFITDDLYVIQSTHGYPYRFAYDWNEESYNHKNNFVGPMQTHKYVPVYKLMSKEFNQVRKDQGEHEKCLLAWHHEYIVRKERDAIATYAKDLLSKKAFSYSRKDCEFIVDAIYYKVNPLQMHYRDGRLKSGFKNHLKRRIKGFANNSFVINEMLQALKDNITQDNRLIEDHNQGDLFDLSTEAILIEMNDFVDNIYPAIAVCHITNKIKLANHMVNMSISGNRRYVLEGIDLSDHDYQLDPDSHCWLLDDEVMIDGSCYKSDTVEITNCTECNARCVVEETRDGLCVECIGRDYRIHNYSHKVEDTLGFLKKGKAFEDPYLGIEIEYQVDKRRSGRLYVGDTLAGHALMKDDGSISNGFEIVSRPASYHAHMLKYESFLDGLPEWIHPHKSCGMHVHISRTAFTHLGAGKLTEFINRKDNEKFIHLIAGRGSTNYQRGNNEYDIKTPYKVTEANIYADRYNYVNLQNSKTIELRIFASPRNTNEFKVRMQFVKAMIQYCQPAALTGTFKEQTSFDSFIKWLERSKKEFKELHTHIKESTLCA